MASDKDTNVEVKSQVDGGPGETSIKENQSQQPRIIDTPEGESVTNESMKEIDLREEKTVETTACELVETLPVNDKMDQKDPVDDNDNDAKKIVSEAQSNSSKGNEDAPQSTDQPTLDSQLQESLPAVIESLSLSDSGVNNDISLDRHSQVGRSDSINEPKSLTSIPMRHANDELSKFHDLCSQYIESNQNMLDSKDISTIDRKHQTNDVILQFLVTDDLSSIKNVDALRILFTDYLQMLPPKIISEILSVLIAIVKKSVFHLESARGLLFPCIKHLTSSEHGSGTKSHVKDTASANLDACISLTKHFLREWVNLLIAHSCDVDELQSIIKLSETDPSLLQFIQQANLKQRNRPHAFFAFPGTKGSMMSLPPFQKWPNQLGWSFSTWFFLEPKACAQPYLYNFKTGKSGLGYSAHFTGNCLVLTSIRVKGKGVQHCVAYEFPSYKWLHCAITYHNKWRASEIKVYVNGQLTANIEMPWQVQTSESFDKCFIGGSGSITRNDRSGDLNCFCGQMSALYLFNEGLSPAQICALHRLGPSYMGQFKYSNESYVNLPPLICKTLYEEKLASSLFSLFTPVAVDSGTLCIQLAPFKSSTSASAQNYFVSAPHAALVGEAKAIITHPICSTLQSLGCSRSLLPLLESYSSSGNSDACVSLIGFLCDLLESSPHWFANEIVQNNVFVIVARALTNNARLLLTDKLLDIFLCLTSTLLTTASSAGDSLLLKHIMDNILFNPSLWVYAEPKVQIKLYHYLASEFLHGTRHGSNRYSVSSSANPAHNQAYHLNAHGNPSYPTNANAITDDQTKSYEAPSIVADLLFGEIRRVSTVLQSLHALKYYYWIEEDCNINHKARNQHLRPNRSELSTIRSYLLQFTQELIARANSTPLDEVQGILNYLSACSRPDNILDVMDTLAKLISEHPSAMVVALDQKQAIKIIFMLIGSCDERVCVKALRLLSQFLSHCSYKKKQDIMGPGNLFMLLCDRLRIHLPLSLNIYEALIDLMIEEEPNDRCLDDKRPTNLSARSIINSTVIKVIATLVYEQRMVNSRPVSNLPSGQVKSSDSTPIDIRKIFINDLWNLIVNSRENRRIILQMSVWQHWLINLMNSTIEESPLVKDQILAIFRVLLYHAIRYEYGGWRVWIDTLAIIHAKVSYDEFCHATSPESPYSSKNNIDSNKHQDHNANLKISRSRPELNDDVGDDEDVTMDASEDNDRSQEDSPSSKTIKQAIVSSISEHIVDQSRGIDMTEENDEDKQQVENVDVPDVIIEPKEAEQSNGDHKHESSQDKEVEVERGSMDSVDLAPSRAYRRAVVDEEPAAEINNQASVGHTNEVSRQQSMTSIALDEESTTLVIATDAEKKADEKLDQFHPHVDHPSSISDCSAPTLLTKKATASPAFRVPDFRWGSILIKLLNDLIFSIECDLYQWRCNAKLASLDAPPFLPKTASTLGNTSNANNSTNPAPKTQIESVLQKPENQIYIINVVHLISQLADNVIIAAGGLLPLLADATGGTRGSSAPSPSNPSLTPTTHEGLTMAQANSLLYRLITMVDMVVFAASHINLGELETDKNTTSGGILRQCLRLACTVTVKNCLVLRAWSAKVAASEQFIMMVPECPKDMFDSYQGCSLLSANGLFEQSALKLDETDLIANLEYSPHQNPNTSSMPSFLPFQTSPIKDPNKLLQIVDIQRIQACIYHTGSTESRQSQFLALSSLYFISVLMVSKYRDIIEPKHKPHRSKSSSNQSSPAPSLSGGRAGDTSPVAGETNSTKATLTGQTSVSSIEANLLNFGKMQPNNSSGTQPPVAPANNSLTDMLTTKLENTLDSVCPLLKTIMCDFCAFLSKTLIGSHGQDLVNKEADRTFRRANASPVEVVMLLCSQEWQNTLQKNAGLAFIELINEGRVLSHGMKDHIVRVAMEADFILRRLRADDVAKHEHFGLACSESLSARLHEEVLINSLISSAARRDYVLYCKFREALQKESQQNYKLDIWEDDDRRKRRYVFDSWDNTTQIFYSAQSAALSDSENKGEPTKSNADTKRILELQKTIELGGIQEQCTQASAPRSRSVSACDSEADNYDDDEDDPENGRDSNSPHSDIAANNRKHSIKDSGGVAQSVNEKGTQWAHDAYHQQQQQSNLNQRNTDKNEQHPSNEPVGISDELKSDPGIWEYDECGSVNDFTGSVIFAAEALLVWSIYAIPGVLQVTTHELHFEPNQNITEAIDALKKEDSASEHNQHGDQGDTDENCIKPLKPTNQNESLSPSEQISLRKIDLKALRYCDFLTCNGKILLSDIRAIFSRHYLLQPNALEIFVSQRTSVMFAFADFDIVKRIVKYLPPVGVGIKYGIPQSRRSSLMSPRQLFAASNMTQRWQKREISNFQYLIFLNTIAGRTYQDLNQYPVFPWILTDYESDELDLNLPKNFRDLSKPIGALNNKRRNEFIERYQSWDNPKVPAFHYGTHYSTAAFTLNWLCRLRGTYNSSYLALQDSKYEESSRLFLSIGDSWVSSLSGGHQNVKELIPEFFYLPEMFHSNLGLAEVEYPPWAKSGEQFVRMHRIALESELVSCQLHQWIDLIFGYKQRGPEAINAVNTFYYLTYQGNVNLNMVQDPSLREAIETQIKHFGQTPSQLSTEPHPPRFSALHASPLMYSTNADEINKVVKFPFNNPIVHISSCINDYIAMSAASGADLASSGGSSTTGSSGAASPSSVLTITSNNQYQIHKWLPDDQSGHPFSLDPQLESALANGPSSSALRRQLIDVEDLCSGITLKLTNLDGSSSYQSSGDVMSEVQWPCAHHIVTLNGRYIIMGSFYDNSFRVFTTESGKLCQVIYGHRGFITCITRSEGNAAADFYIATGGQDCALLIWAWNERYAQVEGSGVSAVQNPLPKLSICGHRSAVLSAMICSELGLVVSGSKNLILVHTLTSGENLLQINMQLPDIMERTLNESKLMHQLVTDSTASIVQRPQVQDKHKTILEASMLGDGGRAASGRQQQADERDKVAAGPRSESPARRVKEERFSQLRDLCCSDYYITSLQFAREPAFIVCVALPPPQRRSKTQTATTVDGSESRSVHCNPPALLLTFNLKGSLMDSTPIGHSSVSSPKLGDICALQVSRDGEYLVLNDSPITIKIYRTFGLQPLYAYNTNDVPSVVGSEEQNRIRSLALLDHRYILAGLDNGRLIVYNCDFKKL